MLTFCAIWGQEQSFYSFELGVLWICKNFYCRSEDVFTLCVCVWVGGGCKEYHDLILSYFVSHSVFNSYRRLIFSNQIPLLDEPVMLNKIYQHT